MYQCDRCRWAARYQGRVYCKNPDMGVSLELANDMRSCPGWVTRDAPRKTGGKIVPWPTKENHEQA